MATTTPARERTAREPAVVRPGPNNRLRSRVRVQWLVLAAALTVLAGVVVAWALTNAADRVPVLSVAQPVVAGDVIEAGDLTVTDVAFDSSVRGLVPARSLDDLVGRIATIDLHPGALLMAGMWADAPRLEPGERSVGASLAAGHFPAGLARATDALAIDLDGDGTAAPVPVRVLDAIVADDGRLQATLAVPEAEAAAVARLAAGDGLALVGVPGDTAEAAP